jgi:hypothetical protein
MSDANLDSIYELEITLPLDTVEYKFTLDGWNISESLSAGLPCTQTTSTFTNRAYIVTGNDSLDAVCWESCSPCFPVGVVNESMPSMRVKAYPNPVQDLLHLDIPINTALNKPGSLRWLDVQGRDVQNLIFSTGQNNTYRVDALNAGLYTVHVRTTQGVQVVRFLKK